MIIHYNIQKDEDTFIVIDTEDEDFFLKLQKNNQKVLYTKEEFKEIIELINKLISCDIIR